MAKFTSFDAPIGTKGPISVRRATAEDFGGGGGLDQVGKALQAFGVELKAKEERADVTRIQTLQSEAMADLTGLMMDLETRAELGAPGHIDAAKNIVNQYYTDRGAAAKGGGGPLGGFDAVSLATTERGQLLLRKQQAEVLSHFTKKAIIFQAASIGAKVKQNLSDSKDADLTTIRNSPDRATFELVLNNRLDLINDPSGAVSKGLKDPKAKAEFTTESIQQYTKARVQGLIKLDPESTLLQLESDTFDKLNPKDVDPLITKAKQGVDALEADEKQADADAKESLAVAREATEQDFLARLNPADITNLPSHQELANSGLKGSTIRALQTIRKGLKNDSKPGALNDTIARIHSGKINNTDDLEKLLANDTLNHTDFKLARKELVGAGTPEGKIAQQLKRALIKQAASAHAVSNDIMRLRNPQGDAIHTVWLSGFLVDWDKAIADGVSPVELVNPKGERYLGAGIKPRSATEIMNDMLVPGGSSALPSVPVSAASGATTKPDINKATQIRRNPSTGETIFIFNGKWHNEDGTVRK
jgi:hypothetical protein